MKFTFKKNNILNLTAGIEPINEDDIIVDEIEYQYSPTMIKKDITIINNRIYYILKKIKNRLKKLFLCY